MTYTMTTNIFAPSKMSRTGFRTVLEQVNSPFAPQADTIAEVIETWPVWGPEWAKPIPLEFMLAICKHEHTYGTNVNSVLHRNDTKSWTNARTVRMPGIPFTIVRDAIRKSDYVKYNDVIDSVRDGLYRLQEPAYAYAKAGADTVPEIIKIWAPADDQNNPHGYTQDVITSMNTWVERFPADQGVDTVTEMKQVTDTVIEEFRSHGFEVHDLRGKLAGNKKVSYRVLDNQFGKGLGGAKYLAVHWTGDRFSREFFKTVTGTDYNTNIISSAMTVDDEIDLVKWYDQYHAGRDGGTWPGLAYGMLIFPSGRIYVCFDIGTLSYHAFNANAVSYAISCPNSQNQAPTTRQEQALNCVIDVLVNQTPEIPMTHKDVYGHRELTFLDTRNQTACPGTFSHVAPHWRNQNKPTVEYKTTPVDVEKLFFPETGKELVLGFKARWEELEQALGREKVIWLFGYPLTNELPPSETGLPYTIQVLERAVWEWHGDTEGLWSIQIVHSGKEWAEKRGLL